MPPSLRTSRLFRVVPAFAIAATLAAACGDDEGNGPPGGTTAAGQGGSVTNGGQTAAGAAGAAGASGAGTGGAAIEPEDPNECPQKLPGPKMIRVTRADGRSACIDQHEITQSQYHAYAVEIGVEGFRKAGFCVGKNGWTPYGKGPEPLDGWGDTQPSGNCQEGPYNPEKFPEAPVGCLAHCHAEAYCAWAGKELCGGFDDAEPLTEKQMLDPQVSVWANACRNGGSTEVSHASKSPDACGPARGELDGQTEPVDAYPECHGQGPYETIQNLSGGVLEWVNATETLPGKLPAWIIMGPLWSAPDAPACGSTPMGTDIWAKGFRCCKRLPK
jgi:hypothetical protein